MPAFVNTTKNDMYYNRHLTPHHHYYPIEPYDICEQLDAMYSWAQAHDDEAMRIAHNARRFARRVLSERMVHEYLKTVLVETGKLIRYDVADLLHHYLQKKALKGQNVNLFMDVVGGMKHITKANFKEVYKEAVYATDPNKYEKFLAGMDCWDKRDLEGHECYPRR